jgi:hypothetical protein
MPWEIYVPPGRGMGRLPIPRITIQRTGFYLNRAALEKIGEDKKFVILFYDPQQETIGFWFKQTQEKLARPEMALKITATPETGMGRITAKTFIDRYDLYAKARKLGTVSFALVEKKEGGMEQDFYVAQLRQNKEKP